MMNRHKLFELTPSFRLAAITLAAGMSLLTPSLKGNPVPPHGVVAANLDIVVNAFDNTADSVTATPTTRIGDFRIRPGSNNGDYNVQIGEDVTDDVDTGLLFSSVRQNGRDNMHPLWPGTNFVTSHLGVGARTEGYWIPTTLTYPNSVATSVIEYDMNVAAAWFPYNQWIAGYAHYSDPGAMNNTTLDVLTGSPGLSLGTHFIDLGNASYTVDLKPIGIDSQKDGVLLVLGAKNEDNYALARANTDGTWTVWSKDNGTDTTSGERDPIGFVFMAKTNASAVSGRFLGNGTIDAFSGQTPRFTITPLDAGRWELKIPGLLPAYGVLLLSPEGGLPGNQDNIVSYEVNAARDGWIIESRDLPAVQQADLSWLCPLETPGDGSEPVASFAFILGATPGVTATPVQNLQTSEAGGTATFEVVLDAEPTADVTIAISSSDPTEGTASPASLTFTPADWNVAQTVTVTGVDDTLEDGPVSYTIVLAPAVSTDGNFNGINPADVSVLNADSEVGITVNPTGGLTTTEAGGTATFSVQLNTQPTAEVVVGLSSSDLTEGVVSPPSLSFTPANWNVPQTVTVQGLNDAMDDGDIAFTIVTAAAVSSDAAYNGKAVLDVTVTNTDDDMVGISVTPVSLDVHEGSTGAYTVVLQSEPATDVVVGVTSSLPTRGSVSSSALTFTAQNWATPQTVTITGSDDLVGTGNVVFIVTNTITSQDPLYASINPDDVSVTLLENDAVLTVPESGVIYGSGMPAIGVATRATLLDANTPNYINGRLTATLKANASPDDRLEVRHFGNGPGEIGVSGANISFEGTPIGTFTGGQGSTPLIVTFNAAANPTNVQALLRAITYRNANQSPSTATRTLELAVVDGDGGTGAASINVRVGLMRIAEFQQGVDHGYGLYTNAADIELSQINPDVPHPIGHNGNGLWIDAQTPGGTDACQALLRFGEIAGDALGQVPTNAIIVYAELVLNVPPDVSNSPGDASPLYRMLVPWDAEFDTYNNVGVGYEGFMPNDIHARSTYDSFFGLENGDASTGTGSIKLGVTADIQAWVNEGQTNYGWLMPGWVGRLDGTVISSSEASNPEARPRLRVFWVPSGTAVASFRQGVNDYTGAVDTRIRKETPDAEGSALTGVFVDWTGSTDQALLRFDEIIGTGPGKIPPGSRIDVAMLDLASMVGNAMGDGGKFHAMLKPWQATDTWNILSDGIQADGIEAMQTPTVVAGNETLNPNVQAAFLSFETTADVQSWADGTRPNYGWAGLPWTNGGDGWGFGTSEQADPRNRPQLRVFYTPGAVVLAPRMLAPVWAGTTIQVRFHGTIGTTYTVERASEPTGPWTPQGTTQAGQDGMGTFTDNSPLPGAGFYRVSR